VKVPQFWHSKSNSSSNNTASTTNQPSLTLVCQQERSLFAEQLIIVLPYRWQREVAVKIALGWISLGFVKCRWLYQGNNYGDKTACARWNDLLKIAFPA
jgi:hypothetical protein